MPVSAKLVTFPQPNGVGDYVYASAGFTPKAAVVIGNQYNANGTRMGCSHWRIGFCDGTDNIGFATNTGNLLNALDDAAIVTSGTYCFNAVGNATGGGLTNSIIGQGYLTFDVNGFTAHFTFNQGDLMNGAVWHVLLLGGDVNAKVIAEGFPLSGNNSYTTGFKPSTVLAATGASSTGGFDFVGPGYLTSFGAYCLCGGNSISLNSFMQNDVFTSNTHRYQDEGSLLHNFNHTTGAITRTVTPVSMDTNGFTVNNSAGNTVIVNLYMALEGCAVNIGSLTQPATASTQTEAILARNPRALILASTGIATATPQDHAEWSFGMTDGTNHGNSWTCDLDNEPQPFKTAQFLGTTNTIEFYTGSNCGASLNSKAIASLGTNLLSLNWSQVDGIQRELFYIVIADILSLSDTEFCGFNQIEGGIHYLKPAKTHDTYYADVLNPTSPITADVKIPNPNAFTAYLNEP